MSGSKLVDMSTDWTVWVCHRKVKGFAGLCEQIKDVSVAMILSLGLLVDTKACWVV